MALTLDGVTLDPSKDSGTKPVIDSTGDNGSIWDTILGNAGGILTGGAALVGAFNRNTPVTNVYQNTPGTGVGNMMGGGMWLYIIIALIAIVALFLIFKK